MLRVLLRRVPRFGLVTLFAAMLLFVSAAGWLKFQLDLWQEEQTLLADLGKAGVDYSYVRHSGGVGASPAVAAGLPMPPPRFWDPLTPLFSRIEKINFHDPEPRELRERAARLPFVRTVAGQEVVTGQPTTESLAATAGFDVERLPAPAVPAELSPLPRGEPVDDASAGASRAAFADALSAEKPAPTRGYGYSVLASPAVRRFYARDANVRFGAFDGAFAITRADSHDTFYVDGAGARQNSRFDDPVYASEMLNREIPSLVMFEPRQYLEINLEELGIDGAFRSALQKPERFGVRRIDDVRVRFDLPPIAADFPAADCRYAYTISIVARSELDWRMEAWDIVGSLETGPNAPANLPSASSASYRGVLRRERDWVVAEEWVVEYLYAPVPPPAGQPLAFVSSRSAGVARYDFSPDLDLSHVTPELFDAKTLPPQRKLPWLRWHRVTFALSLGLFAFVGGRRFVRRKALRRESA